MLVSSWHRPLCFQRALRGPFFWPSIRSGGLAWPAIWDSNAALIALYAKGRHATLFALLRVLPGRAAMRMLSVGKPTLFVSLESTPTPAPSRARLRPARRDACGVMAGRTAQRQPACRAALAVAGRCWAWSLCWGAVPDVALRWPCRHGLRAARLARWACAWACSAERGYAAVVMAAGLSAVVAGDTGQRRASLARPGRCPPGPGCCRWRCWCCCTRARLARCAAVSHAGGRARRAVGAVGLPAPARVLDAGCGLGHGLRALRRAYPAGAHRRHGVELAAGLAGALCAAASPRCGAATCGRRRLGRLRLVYLFQRPESMAARRGQGAAPRWRRAAGWQPGIRGGDWLPQAVMRLRRRPAAVAVPLAAAPSAARREDAGHAGAAPGTVVSSAAAHRADKSAHGSLASRAGAIARPSCHAHPPSNASHRFPNMFVIIGWVVALAASSACTSRTAATSAWCCRRCPSR